MFLLEDIKKNYNGKQALDIQKLSLYRKGITLLCGPNGSGKTTLLNILAFLDFGYEGSLWFKNRIIKASSDYTSLRRKVCLLMEHPYFFKGSVFDNIAYGLKVRGLTRAQIFSKVEDILEKLKLIHFKDQNVNSLSGGERQRMALARVLVLDTEIILLDEPSLRMDKDSQKLFESIILDYSRDRMIIMACHNSSSVNQLTDKIIHIMDGKIRIETAF